jgi:hypothetical protein
MAENIQEEIEDKVIDCIVLGANGRLVVFKPEKLDKNLVVEKRNDYKKKVIFLNIYSKEFSKNQDFKKEINELASRKNLDYAENFYLIFVYFNSVKQELGDEFLVIPSQSLEKIADSAEYSNNFSEFLINKKDFARFLIAELEKK